ncbi:MAG: periplasmic heavy metal sensor [Candidatus Margulisiibacteriota bacterium]
MKVIIKSVALALLVLVFSTASLAAPWWGGKERKRDPGKQIAQRLNLTAAQQAQFKTAREKLEKENKPLFDKIKERSDKLRSELEKDKPDQRLIEQSIKEINGWRTEIEIKRVKSLLELKASLTPDQRQKFQGMMRPPRPRGFGRGPQK